MPDKRGISNSILLARIDERVKVLPEMNKEIKEIKYEQIKHCESLKTHHHRLKKLERAGVGYNLYRILTFIFRGK